MKAKEGVLWHYPLSIKFFKSNGGSHSRKLCCPLNCDSVLVLDGKTWRCNNGHSFDVAKQGYVNLLPVQNKRSKGPTVTAKLWYRHAPSFSRQWLLSATGRGINTHVLHQPPQSILDAGCGEGYYLRQILDAAQTSGLNMKRCRPRYFHKWASASCGAQRQTRNLAGGLKQSNPNCWQAVSTPCCGVFGPFQSKQSLLGFLHQMGA